MVSGETGYGRDICYGMARSGEVDREFGVASSGKVRKLVLVGYDKVWLGSAGCGTARYGAFRFD